MKHITTVTVDIDSPRSIAFWENWIATAIKKQVKNELTVKSLKIDFSSDNADRYDQLRREVSALQEDLNRHHNHAIINAKIILKRKAQNKQDAYFKRVLKKLHPDIYKAVVERSTNG